jgi:mRNA-decapping enzyme 1B
VIESDGDGLMMMMTMRMMRMRKKKKLNLFLFHSFFHPSSSTSTTLQVIASAGHVALYDYDTSTEAWRRKDIEGSLFILKRSSEPRFQMLILNKKSTTNYSEDVLGGFEFENAPPYLLYRNERDEVFGVWFYDQGECARLEGILQKIVKDNANGGGGAAAATAAAPVAPSSSRAQQQGGGGGGDFWDQPASLPAGYDPLGGAARAGQQPQQQQQEAQQQQQQQQQ